MKNINISDNIQLETRGLLVHFIVTIKSKFPLNKFNNYTLTHVPAHTYTLKLMLFLNNIICSTLTKPL